MKKKYFRISILLYDKMFARWRCQLSNQWTVTSMIRNCIAIKCGAVLRWERGQLPPNLGLTPQMWHETLFDEPKASAYMCKKVFCGIQNMPKCVSGWGLRQGAQDASPDPLVGWGRDIALHTHPTWPRFSSLGAHHLVPWSGGDNIFVWNCPCIKSILMTTSLYNPVWVTSSVNVWFICLENVHVRKTHCLSADVWSEGLLCFLIRQSKANKL